MEKAISKQQAIYRAAAELFAKYGWIRVSVEEICTAAGVSRVTFYKYFDNKKSLLCRMITDHKNEIRSALTQVQNQAVELETAITALFDLQQASLSTLYSEAMLHDIGHHHDDELRLFFDALDQEKYDFMRTFFSTLQQRKLIRNHLPPALIDAFIRQIDILIRQPEVVSAYAGNQARVFEDALHLLLYGLSYRTPDTEAA